MFSNEFSKHAYVSILVSNKVEAEHAPKPQLQQVVIQAFLAYSDQISGIFQRVTHRFSITHINPVIQFAPQGDPFNYETDLAFFSATKIIGELFRVILLLLLHFIFHLFVLIIFFFNYRCHQFHRFPNQQLEHPLVTSLLKEVFYVDTPISFFYVGYSAHKNVELGVGVENG